MVANRRTVIRALATESDVLPPWTGATLSDPHPLDLLIRKLGTHAALSPEDRDAVLGLPYVSRTLEAGTYLVREGDPPSRCGVLSSGFAYRQKHTGDGQRQIVGLHIPGE